MLKMRIFLEKDVKSRLSVLSPPYFALAPPLTEGIRTDTLTIE